MTTNLINKLIRDFSMKYPISVIIRTLNEEKNIEECIHFCIQNNPYEIIVVDGNSNDKTREIVRKFKDVKLISCEKGLARQRDKGINACSPTTQYIAIVDADDRLDKKCLMSLMWDLEQNKSIAVQAIHESYSKISGEKMNYFEKAMLVNMQIIRDIDKNRTVTMVGRPALYEKKALLKAITKKSDKFTSSAEDSDLAYTLIKNGGKFTIGTGITYRKHLKTFKELRKRWMSYGSGDAKFIEEHPERRFAVLKHQLYVYPVKRAFFCATHYHIKYSPFFMLQGWFRFFGMTKYMLFGTGKIDDYKI